jgi:ketosteroid isomerase-like protein
MSQENVEIVKTFVAPAGTDYAGVDYTDLFSDEVAWGAFRDAVEPLFAPNFEGAFVASGFRMEFAGLDGMRRAFLEWLTPWTTYYDETEDVLAAGDDRVVVLARQHGYRLDTEAEVVAETAGVYLLRNGKIVQLDLYANRAEAFEAVGLSEQDAPSS